ncbi:MAG: hypothetical protein JXA82_07005 [Sedimentisphaerales bacterium]|nr:hypothetical protein [Sedimentisphaerales bacterium]
MSFATVINCMDGRTQLPVIEYLKGRFGVEYVDSITEPGPIRILAEQTNQRLLDSICVRLDISVDKHKSRAVAIVAHHDCTGNPLPKKEQLEQLNKAMGYVAEHYPEVTVLGLWVDDHWQVSEIS